MDAKNNEYTRLTVDEFNAYVNMLNGHDDDYNIAIESIKNTNVCLTLVKLLGKSIRNTRRLQFLKNFGVTNKEFMTFACLYKEVKAYNDDAMKTIFENSVSNIMLEGMSELNKISFIESLNIKIKW